ncbi:Alpha-L-arabinofuranosidase [Treponema sp. JC4]|uniref:arabinosylfuranosidase ArfA n=1 Tax=Treponema sp. JC4 TaxID=1124982 RepID=UPI00025B0C8F|nr:alpha-N-arabinofuranosidase [Treponema sp. JC4]EID84610.1 Alpha-L-arabinofuranosidase [Treponema sp. JC4]
MNTKVIISKDFKVGEVDKNLFSSFVEHLGRAVYTGVYEPGHPQADEQGFRKDVIDMVKDLKVSLVRYPGGNFLSGYNWKDGIGPKENRPRRLDRAWHTIESNQVGIDEFYDWTVKSGTEIMGAVNMGTGTVQDAGDLVEYCNFDRDTYWSDLRRKNGHDKPFAIKTWCIGNEMDGPWQICHLTADDYGKKAREAIKLMKWTDESIKTVVCGSASTSMPTYPEWDRIVLEHTYDLADYISIHRYFENFGDDDEFLASFYDMDQFIKTSVATCDYVKALKRSNKVMNLSFDEWNIWYQQKMQPHPWMEAPRILEDHYSLLDALAFGGMAITLLNHADRVKVACLAQLVNVIAPIFTEPGKGAYKQSIYFPFKDISLFGRGTALQPVVTTGKKIIEKYGEVPSVIFASVLSEDESEVTVFALNTDKNDSSITKIDLSGVGKTQMFFRTELCGDDLSATNSLENPRAVEPKTADLVQGDGSIYEVELKKASWNVLRFKIA